MLLDVPDPEYWFSGYAPISFVVTLFALVLSALGAGPVLTKRHHRQAIWLGVAAVAAISWFLLAKQEEEKAKPGLDWVHLVPSNDFANGRVRLNSVATGVVRDVKVAINRTEDHNNGRWNYICCPQTWLFDEGAHGTGIGLPLDDYMIDIDPPTKGKVLQGLRLAKDGDQITATISVKRKSNNDTLLPRPVTNTPLQKAYVVFSVICFAVFSGALFIASSGGSVPNPARDIAATIRALDDLVAEGTFENNRLIPTIPDYNDEDERTRFGIWRRRVLELLTDHPKAYSKIRTLHRFNGVFHTAPGKTREQEKVEAMWTEAVTRLRGIIETL